MKLKKYIVGGNKIKFDLCVLGLDSIFKHVVVVVQQNSRAETNLLLVIKINKFHSRFATFRHKLGKDKRKFK